MSNNPLLQAWHAQQQVFGLWASLPDSIVAEFMARQGPGYVCVDYQHGLIDHSTAIGVMQGVTAGGSVAIARTAWNTPSDIMAVLDAGAAGVIVPMVNNAEEAQRAVSAARFPPAGIRSYGPVRARATLGSGHLADLDDVACIVMVETAEALYNVDEIAATPGLTGLYIGPSDLAIDLDQPLGDQHVNPDMREAMAKIRDAAHRHGVICGVHSPNGDVAAIYANDGFDMITVCTDLSTLNSAVRAELDKVARFRD